MRSYWSRMYPIPDMSDVLIRRGNLDTDLHTGRTSCKDDGRDWLDAYTN